MENKWQFDREFMLKAVWYGQSLLCKPNISTRNKREIKMSVNILTSLMEKNYEFANNVTPRITSDLEKLKRIALNKMRLIYKLLGVDLIKWLLDLTVLGIFDVDTELKKEKTNLDFDTQVDLTKENYSIHSKKYLEVAEEIIANSQIELAGENDFSFSIYEALTNLSFVVVNPNEYPWVFNHEIQHAIEDMCLYQTPDMYDELGPQYFEMLFLDNLYDKQGYLLTGDYISKMEDAKYFLDVLYGYLNCILVFKNSGFDVSLDNFINTIIECYEVDGETAVEILKTELVPNEPIKDMNYLFSYLKAIELRERTLLTKMNSHSILEPYINSKRFKFCYPKDTSVYERFACEMQQKTRVLKK